MIRILLGILVFAAAIFFAVKLAAVHWILTVIVAAVGGFLAAKIAF